MKFYKLNKQMFNPLNFINKIFKSDNEKQLKRLRNLVIKINNKEQEVKKIDQKNKVEKSSRREIFKNQEKQIILQKLLNFYIQKIFYSIPMRFNL